MSNCTDGLGESSEAVLIGGSFKWDEVTDERGAAMGFMSSSIGSLNPCPRKGENLEGLVALEDCGDFSLIIVNDDFLCDRG